MSTPTTTPSTTSTPASRLTALGRAEGLQFLRNKTLLFMATVTPLLVPLGMYFLLRRVDETTALVTSAEGFILFVLLFVQFYSVLSMVTTRRDERVLRRLRIGEARDVEILAAISLPGAVITVALTVIFLAVLFIAGASLPVNPLFMLLALVCGIVISAALAIIASAFTQNAEAAQLTSLPVIILAVVSMSANRELLPDTVGRIVGFNPFALISDLMQQGWAGTTGGGDLTDPWRPVLYLVLWTVVAVWEARRWMRWETHR